MERLAHDNGGPGGQRPSDGSAAGGVLEGELMPGNEDRAAVLRRFARQRRSQPLPLPSAFLHIKQASTVVVRRHGMMGQSSASLIGAR